MTVAPKTISQETFDEAVQQNIDTFDMEPDEAVAEAVQEFEMSGVDLKGVIKTYAGEGGRGEHPVVALVKELEAAIHLKTSQPDSPEVSQTLQDALQALLNQLKDGEAGGCENAGRNGAVEAVLSVCGPQLRCCHPLALNTMKALMQDCRQNRMFFQERQGVETLLSHLGMEGEDEAAGPSPAVFLLLAEAAKEYEPTKAQLMLLGGDEMLVTSLRRAHESGGNFESVQAVCAVLRSLTTADDLQEAASGAFRNAQALAKVGAASVLLEVLGSLLPTLDNPTAAEDPAAAAGASSSATAKLAASLCATLKGVAANEEVCKQVAEGGGVEAIVRVLSGGGGDIPSLAKQACVLLRQLAGSDTIKPIIVASQGIQGVLRVLGTHSSSSPPSLAVVEAGLGVLAALCLRNPPGAEALAEAGALDATVELMKNHPQASNLQRQACMLLRNAVARNKESLGPRILALGAETLLVQAKRNHPKACVDVGSAALRDLGCDNYNEGWKPTTIIMGADGVERTAEELDEEYKAAQQGKQLDNIQEASEEVI